MQSIFHVYKKSNKMVTASRFLYSWRWGPLFTAVIMYDHHDTPGTLPWLFADRSLVIKLILIFTDWVFATLALFLSTVVTILLGEALAGIALITKSLR